MRQPQFISLTHGRLQLMVLLCVALLTQHTNSYLFIDLSRTQQSPSNTAVNIYSSSASPQLNSTFVRTINSNYNCSLSLLYTYSQSFQQYKSNSPYYLLINSSSLNNTTVSINTVYDSIKPQINGSQEVTCTSYPCELQIINNCESKITYYNYFDIVKLNISSIDTEISYYVLCKSEFQGNSFEYGLFLEIFLGIILITVVALYSKAWSIGGAGWQINLPLVIVFNVLLVIGGILGAFLFEVLSVAVLVLSWIFGLAAVWLCTNQLFFLIKSTDMLRKQLFRVKSLGVRVLDIFSLFISIGVCIGWQLSSNNWIVNDVIAISMIIAAIKFFKFTSLKQALICFAVTIGVEMVFVLVLTFKIKASYNTAILNIFNNPFQLQLPTINNVYNQKCAWLPVTSFIYPGALMSYMRRFDTSRNTKVYIITCVCVLMAGSIVWLVISVFSKNSYPFGLIAEPAAIGLISFFAWKRKQIRTIWTGKFYDEQFVHKEGLKTIEQSIERERDKTQIVYSPELFAGLHMNQEQSSMEYPDPSHGPISKKVQEQQQKKQEPKPGLDQSLLSNKSSQASGFRKIQLSQIKPQNKKQENKNSEQEAQNNQRNRAKSKFPQAIQKGAM